MQKVKDLIKQLEACNPDLPVVTPGSGELDICSIEISLVEVYSQKATTRHHRDRLDFREPDQSGRPKEGTISDAILITFGDPIELAMYIVKERILSIVECPPWAEHDIDSGRIRLYASTEEAFIEAPHDVELYIADDSGELDETKLATYLLRNYPEYIEEYWLDRHAFTNLPAAHEFADAQSFAHGSKIESIPFN